MSGHGNVVHNGGSRLLWWIMGLFGVLTTAGVMFVGQALYSLNARLASVEAKIELMIVERAPRYRGGGDGQP